MGHCTVFVCSGLPQDARSSPPRTRVRHSRPALLKWLLSLLVCCWTSKPSRSSGDSENGESVEIGPMTLREYISTLEPYDPEIHGWRGEEPHRIPLPGHFQPKENGAIAVKSPVKCKCAYASISYQPRRRDSPYLRRSHVV